MRETLEQARADSPEIATFIDALEANRAERAEAVRHHLDLTGLSYNRVREVIASQPSRQLGLVVLQRWGRAASDEDLARAAADLLAESDEDRLISYLRIFGKRRFPLDPAPLLPLVRHAHTRLVAATFTMLSHLTDARVRGLALDLLQDEQVTGWARSRAVDLLVANYLAGDAERLAGWLSRSRDRDEFHAIGVGVRTVLEAHPSSGGAAALLALYEYGPCSLCRTHAVELLYGLSAVPTWMFEECRFDAVFDLRAKVETWLTLP